MARHGRHGGIMVYEWKQARFGKADAQRVGEELAGLGYRDAASVVNAARSKRRELHKCFEWDDSKAGEAYRLEQARLVLRMLVTVEEVPGEVTATIIKPRAFESVYFSAPDGDKKRSMAYVPVREALSDPELRMQVMGRLDSTIAEAEETAKQYQYLVPAFGKTRERLAEARATMRE